MSEEPEKKVRITLTKSQLSTARGAELFNSLSRVTQDGLLTNAEIDELKAWLSKSGIEALPAEQHLAKTLSLIIANGSISPEERCSFQKEIERVLPPSKRAEAKATREARELEFAELKKSTTDLNEECPETQPRPDSVSTKQQAKQAALVSAVAAHRIQPGQKTFEITIPGRQPYEPSATMKQKDYLWGLGMRDQRILETLGKWQASAVIDLIKNQQGSSGGIVMLLFVILLVFVGLGLVAKCSQ